MIPLYPYSFSVPYCVSEGAQKNFKKFTMRLAERGNYVPDAKYYERLIAKAILFRRTEKLVQQQQYGGYRANIVTYTIAYEGVSVGICLDFCSVYKNVAETDFSCLVQFLHQLVEQIFYDSAQFLILKSRYCTMIRHRLSL